MSRVLLNEMELTPARFDMMRIVEMHSDGVAQQKIMDLLGVSGATVSRMLKSLEKLGFVERVRMPEDRRRVLVKTTWLGARRVTHAYAMLINSLVSHRLAWRTLAFLPRDAGPKLAKLEETLCGMRKVLGDASPYPDPWRNAPLAEALFPVNTLVDGRIAYIERAATG